MKTTKKRKTPVERLREALIETCLAHYDTELSKSRAKGARLSTLDAVLYTEICEALEGAARIFTEDDLIDKDEKKLGEAVAKEMEEVWEFRTEGNE